MHDLKREVLRVREERVEDRRMLLRIYDEMTRGFGEMKSDLLLLDNRLLNLRSRILGMKGRLDDASAPAGK